MHRNWLPWENSYCESFNSKLREELLNGEIFYSLRKGRFWRSAGESKSTHGLGSCLFQLGETEAAERAIKKELKGRRPNFLL